jgi:MoaA/NifB/PqqE/SkfB family radical SAM enzyme
MYKYEDIKAVHLEITSKCNAHCPMCLRNVLGGKPNPQLPLSELSIADIKNIFAEDFVQRLERIYLCGNYGDPIVAKDTLDCLKYFKSVNPKIRLDVFTNGSARNKEWWAELAQYTDSVHFGIDGLSDTNAIYRRGTQFEKIMENAANFIQNGGNAIWDFIAFKHNEHQIEDIQNLAKEMGFKKLNIKKTGRFFSNTQLEGKNKQEVYKKDGEFDYWIEMPTNVKYQNQALQKETQLVDKYGSLENYLNQTPIDCKVVKEHSLYVSAQAHVFPCCWTANQLFPWYYEPKSSYIWKLINKTSLGIDGLDSLKYSLKEIIAGEFFQEVLPTSWNKNSLKEGKPNCCAKTCGKEFDPFKAQFI